MGSFTDKECAQEGWGFSLGRWVLIETDSSASPLRSAPEKECAQEVWGFSLKKNSRRKCGVSPCNPTYREAPAHTAFVNFANANYGYGRFIASTTQEEILQATGCWFSTTYGMPG